MADDPTRTKEDRKLISAEQPYEVSYFARKWKLTRDQARKIIARFGPSREDCNKAAERLNG